MADWRCALAIALVGATAGAGAVAQAVQRCEGADGRVTYSDAVCPPGTRSARAVDTDPPIKVHEQAAAKARAAKDAAKVQRLEQQRKEEAEESRRLAEHERKDEARRAQRCERERRELDKLRAAREASASTVKQMQAHEKVLARQQRNVEQACKR